MCCQARTGRICFDLDGNLIEDWNGIKTRTGSKMKEDYDGRWKRKPKDEKEDVARISHSVSTSVLVCHMKEMAGKTTKQKKESSVATEVEV